MHALPGRLFCPARVGLRSPTRRPAGSSLHVGAPQHHHPHAKKNFALLLIKRQLRTYLTRPFCLSGKQDYKKTKPALRAARLKAEAKKSSSGFRVNLHSPPLHSTRPPPLPSLCLCRPSFVPPTTAIPSVGSVITHFHLRPRDAALAFL